MTKQQKAALLERIKAESAAFFVPANAQSFAELLMITSATENEALSIALNAIEDQAFTAFIHTKVKAYYPESQSLLKSFFHTPGADIIFSRILEMSINNLLTLLQSTTGEGETTLLEEITHSKYYPLFENKILELPDDEFLIFLNSTLAKNFIYNPLQDDTNSFELINRMFTLSEEKIVEFLSSTHAQTLGTDSYYKSNFYKIIESIGLEGTIKKLQDSNVGSENILKLLTAKISTKKEFEKIVIYNEIIQELGIDSLASIANLLNAEDKRTLEENVPFKSDSFKFDVARLNIENEDVRNLISKIYYAKSAENDTKIVELAKILEKLTTNQFFANFIHHAANMFVDVIVSPEISGARGFYITPTNQIIIKDLSLFSTFIHEYVHAMVHRYLYYDKSSDVDNIIFALHHLKGCLTEEEVNLAHKHCSDSRNLTKVSASKVAELATMLKIDSASLLRELEIIKSEYLTPLTSLVVKDSGITITPTPKNIAINIQGKLADSVNYIANGNYQETKYSTELIAYITQAISETLNEGITIQQVIDALIQNCTITEIPSCKIEWTISYPQEGTSLNSDGSLSEPNSPEKKSSSIVGNITITSSEGWTKKWSDAFPPEHSDPILLSREATYIISSEIPAITLGDGVTLEAFRTQAANLLKVVKFVTGYFGECVEMLNSEHEALLKDFDASIASVVEGLVSATEGGIDHIPFYVELGGVHPEA